MMTRKDRKIANQEAMIKSRDKVIKYQEEKIAKLEAKLRQIKVIAESNSYGRPDIYLEKIKELVRPLNQN